MRYGADRGRGSAGLIQVPLVRLLSGEKRGKTVSTVSLTMISPMHDAEWDSDTIIPYQHFAEIAVCLTLPSRIPPHSSSPYRSLSHVRGVFVDW